MLKTALVLLTGVIVASELFDVPPSYIVVGLAIVGLIIIYDGYVNK